MFQLHCLFSDFSSVFKSPLMHQRGSGCIFQSSQVGDSYNGARTASDSHYVHYVRNRTKTGTDLSGGIGFVSRNCGCHGYRPRLHLVWCSVHLVDDCHKALLYIGYTAGWAYIHTNINDWCVCVCVFRCGTQNPSNRKQDFIYFCVTVLPTVGWIWSEPEHNHKIFVQTQSNLLDTGRYHWEQAEYPLYFTKSKPLLCSYSS